MRLCMHKSIVLQLQPMRMTHCAKVDSVNGQIIPLIALLIIVTMLIE